MPRFCKTRGLIIKRRKYGEADYILTIFSEDLGKIQAHAKGIRKATGKLRGQAELFNLVKMELFQGKIWDLVVGLETMHPFAHLKKDLARIVWAQFLASFIDHYVAEGGRDSRLYRIFRDLLLALDACPDRCQYLKQMIAGQWSLLQHLGLLPRFDQCVECGRALQGAFLRQGEGGFYCIACTSGRGGPRVSAKLLPYFQKQRWTQIQDARTLEKLNLVLANFLNLALPYRLSACAWLHSFPTVS